jgi:CubicO group peptidase (beta-lactamase class C family)
MAPHGSLSAILGAFVVAAIALTPKVVQADSSVPPGRFTDAQRKQRLMQALPQIETLLSDRMRDANLPGLAYGVVIDNEVVLSKGLGLSDVAAGAKVDGKTVFRIASMTKSFTALAILKLRDAGKLRLDDPADLYVPELRKWTLATKDSGPITIRQLLGHTAGLPEDNPQGDRVLDLTPEAFSAWVGAGVPYSNAPGSGFEYSNLGFMLLGSVVTKVSGRPFQQYITEEILLPLGMQSTHWSASKVAGSRLAKGYRREKESWVEEPLLEDGAGAAMGGLMTSADDLGRFVAMMLSAYPPRDDPERAPVARRTLRDMQSGLGYPSVVVVRDAPGAPLIARGGSYGYGLFATQDCMWGREVSHSGGLPGFGSHMRWLPDHGVGVFAMANLTYADAASLTRAAMTALYDTGALKSRAALPSPELVRMTESVTDLLVDWKDDRARAIAADNLFLDESLEERRSSITKLRSGLGSCKRGQLDAENALRGRFRIDCEAGWLNVELTLAPVQPPRVQFLEVSAGRPASPALKQAAETLTAAMASGTRSLRLAPGLKKEDVAARLEATRSAYGTCKLGDVIEGDGVGTAKFMLACDRGALELSISVEEGRITKAMFGRPAEAVCVP